MRSRTARRLALLASLVLSVLWLASPLASAHATLDSTYPGQGSVVPTSPSLISASFDESVGVSSDSLRVFGPDGSPLSLGATTHGRRPNVIHLHVARRLAAGTYTVAWHVVSADSHPVQGAFTFSVEHASAHSALTLPKAGSTTVVVTYAVVRVVAYLGFALLAGGGFFLLSTWWPGFTDRLARRLLWSSSIVLTVATVAGLLLQGVYAAGQGLTQLFDPVGLEATLDSRIGMACLVRLAAVGGLAWLVALLGSPAGRRRRARLGTGWVVLALITAATWPLSDHASVGRQVPLAVGSDIAHLSAAAAWVGGLAMLLTVLLRPGCDQSTAAPVVARFSRNAAWYVVLILASGTYQTWRNLGHWAAFVHTTYGLLLLGKIVGLVILIGLGANARRLIGGGLLASRSPTLGDWSRQGLRRSVGVEATVVLAVMAATSVLVNTPTGRESYHPTVSVTRPFTSGGRSGTILVTVMPAVLGPQTVTVTVHDRQDRAYTPRQIGATFSLPAQRLGPLTLGLHRVGPGRYRSSPQVVSVAGNWTLDVLVRTSSFDETTIAIPVPIR